MKSITFLTNIVVVVAVLFVVPATTASTSSNKFDVEAASKFHSVLSKAVLLIQERQSSKSNVEEEIHRDDAGGKTGGGLRHLSGMSEEESTMADLLTCQSELAAMKEKEEEPTLLYVQMADNCNLTQTTQEDGTFIYKLMSNSMDDDTYSFSDRPMKVGGSLPTELFIQVRK